MPANIRYEPNETPSWPTCIGLAAQLAALTIAAIVVIPAVVARAAGVPDYLPWAIFAGIIVSGLMTIVQAKRVRRFGTGHVLIVGISSPYIGICVATLADHGPAAIATLTTLSAIVAFGFSRYMSALRKILTPTVTGTVVMLVPATVMPVIVDELRTIPETASPEGATLAAAVTVIVSAAMAISTSGRVRLWSPIAGIAAGSAVAVPFGLYDYTALTEAPWVGLPAFGWPGLALDIATFWSALPAFLLITLVSVLATVGDATAIQRISWRAKRRPDYRTVQGAVNADGAALVASGLAGTLPTGVASAGVAVVEQTGVAAKAVGIVTGVMFLVLAFAPKVLAVVVAIPAPVTAAYLAVLMAGLFIVGIRIVTDEPLDHRAGIIVGIAFWLGVGVESNVLYAEFLSTFAGGILADGITVGGLAAIAMTAAARWKDPKPYRVDTVVSTSALTSINTAIAKLQERMSWSPQMRTAIESVCEETLLSLLGEPNQAKGSEAPRRLRVLLSCGENGEATAEFLASSSERNLEQDLAVLSSEPLETHIEHELPLRLLRHVASAVEHWHYHDLDIVNVRIDPR